MNKQQLASKIWESANKMRSRIELMNTRIISWGSSFTSICQTLKKNSWKMKVPQQRTSQPFQKMTRVLMPRMSD